MGLQPGDPAPDFSLPAHDGSTAMLPAERGRWVLLWWFPKASTPTCTKEGCGIRDRYENFEAVNCAVYGVSYDSPEDNAAWAREHRFPYRLLSDTDRSVSARFGTVKEPDEDAWPDMPRRMSFLVDPNGTVVKVYRVTDAPAHASEVLADIVLHSASAESARLGDHSEQHESDPR